MSTIYLAEISGANTSGTVTVFRYATGGYSTLPADTPASTYYEGRIRQPGLLRRDLFSQGRTSGRSEIGYGVLEIDNADGALDALLDFGFDGRPLVIKVGDDAAAYSTFTTVLAGTLEQADFSTDKVSFRIRDYLQALDKVVQPTKYAGNNALPAGVEGTADDIKGNPKPLLYGKVYGIEPVQVNTTRRIYQVNAGAVNTIAVYDAGIALTAGAAYASQVDMETNAPAAGQYRAWLAGGMFRLGSTPAGQVTADVTQTASTANHTAAQILKALALQAGISSGSISAADVTALDTANGAELGIYLAQETSALEAMDEVAASVGAYYIFDSAGALRMGVLLAPTGSPVLTLTESDMTRIERVPTNDTERSIPAWRVRLGWQKNYTPQTRGDLATAVTDARAAVVAQPWRITLAEDAAVLNQYPLAPELARNTLLVDGTAAGTEASRLLTLYKTRRDMFRITARLNTSIDINNVLTVLYTRFGLSAGKLFRVLGIRPDLASGEYELTVWG